MRSDVLADDINFAIGCSGDRWISPSSLYSASDARKRALRASPGTLCPSASVAAPRVARRAKRGGARRDRTDDLMLAKHALSQLSYGPMSRSARNGQPVFALSSFAGHTSLRLAWLRHA
jgi:hypothetical protein